MNKWRWWMKFLSCLSPRNKIPVGATWGHRPHNFLAREGDCLHGVGAYALVKCNGDMLVCIFRGDVWSAGDGNAGGVGMVPGTAGDNADASLRRRNGNQQSRSRSFRTGLITFNCYLNSLPSGIRDSSFNHRPTFRRLLKTYCFHAAGFRRPLAARPSASDKSDSASGWHCAF